MRLSNVAHLYVVRLKARVVLVQELFTILGIAVGVALLFASQIASTSLNGSVSQLTSGVVGGSTYQLRARSQLGFSESLLKSVQRLAGVSAAVPVLETPASISGPHGRADVDLVASDPRFVRLAGPLLRRFTARQLAGQQALALPSPIAKTVGVGPLESANLALDGRVVRALVAAELSEANIGALANSPVAVAPLSYAQSLTGMTHRLTRIFVGVLPGHDRQVHGELVALAGGRLNVQPADFDATLFAQAADPVNQSTTTFALICALVGFMFAYCSMLLTIELRRTLVRQLRRNGATRWETVKTLLFDALVLGVIASVVGLALGDLLSAVVFPTKQGYLSFAFPVGSQRIITWRSVTVSVAAGLFAAGVGVLTPMREVWERPGRRLAGRRRVGYARQTLALVGGIGALALTSAIFIFVPQAAIAGVVVLIVALVLVLPVVVDGTVEVFDRLQRPAGRAASEIAVAELRGAQTRTRAVAISATAAIAVFGSVAIQGAHINLQHGLDRLVHQLSMISDVWVLAPGEQNTLATDALPDTTGAKLLDLAGVRAVGRYRASFMEYGARRVWVLAPPAGVREPIPPSQLTTGSLGQAAARLREGGWAVVSQALADAHHLRIGSVFTLPAPRPLRLRVAAMSTNLGWPAGAIILNPQDYISGWQNSAPSAYNVMLAPGAPVGRVIGELRRVLGSAAGVEVESERQRESTQDAVSHQGLGRITQIAILVLVGGLLATATSMGSSVWQRRRGFARLKFQGLAARTLWASLLWESVLLLGSGCFMGALFGVYGQLLISHALMNVTGFPVIFSADVPLALGSFALVTLAAAAVIGIPGYRAASVQPYPYS